MTVLEAFVHDPLVEWTKANVSIYPLLTMMEADSQKRSRGQDVRVQGEQNLGPIKKKLAGHVQQNRIDKIMTVPNQVDWLIKQATGPGNLVRPFSRLAGHN